MSALAARRAAQAARATPSAAIAEAPRQATPSPTPSVSDLVGSSDSEAGPSKRRKVSKKNARYFAPEDEVESLAAVPNDHNSTKRARRFSPSAPASEVEDETDSSDDSSAGKDVDEGRADWTVPSTPRVESASTISRKAQSPASSRFKAVNGVNFQLVSSDALEACGITGTGQGAVLSLGKQDVSAQSPLPCCVLI